MSTELISAEPSSRLWQTKITAVSTRQAQGKNSLLHPKAKSEQVVLALAQTAGPLVTSLLAATDPSLPGPVVCAQ